MPFPVLLRVASLPVTELEQFHNPALIGLIHRIAGLREMLHAKRDELANVLYQEIATRIDPVEKEALLKLKRSCGMNKALSPQAAALAGEHLADPIAGVTSTETALTDAESQLGLLYAEAHERECKALQSTFLTPELLCGISFSSESLVSQMLKFRATGTSESRKLRRMELAWLGFLSRAVTKPSPFSTLTRVGLGLLDNSEGLRMVREPWSQHSIVRVKRYILDQCFQQLLEDPDFLESLQLDINYTLKALEDNQQRFFAPGKWRPSSSLQYEFKLEAMARIRLPRAVAEFLEQWFAEGPKSFRETLAAAQQNLQIEDGAQVEGVLRQLITTGAVVALTPWNTNAASLESELLSYLRSLRAEKFAPVSAELSELCRLEEGCTQHPENAPQLIRDMTRKVDDIWAAIHRLLPAQDPAKFTVTKMLIKQDLFVSAGPSWGEIGRVPMQWVTRANDSLRYLAEVTGIFWMGYDFLLTAAAVADIRRDRSPLPLEEYLERTRGLWREFTGHLLRHRKQDVLREPFNPLNLSGIAELHALRIRIREAIREIVFTNGDGEAEISIPRLRQIYRDMMPGWYYLLLAPCLFMQPTDATMQRWVFNQCSDGTARLSSRFVHLMPEKMREAYLNHVRACSSWVRKDRRIEFLDVSTIQGEMLNVHPPQTTYLLRLPGDAFDVSAERQLRFSDLSLTLDEESGMPILMAPGGIQLLPVQLGGVGHDFISSSTIRHMCVLGPPTQLPYIPDAPVHDIQGINVSARLVIGNLVLRRKRWTAPCSSLPQPKTTGTDVQFYSAVNLWRRAAGIPDKCYVKLDIDFDAVTNRHKPQFMDFSSTLFLRMLASMIQDHAGKIDFEEAMPMPAQGQHCGNGAYVFEVLSDPLLYRFDFPPGEKCEATAREESQPVSACCDRSEAFS
jgi:hypothetical protein